MMAWCTLQYGRQRSIDEMYAEAALVGTDCTIPRQSL